MKVNEIFEGIQGEGRYVGKPMLFIRVSGCNRNCEWCDTKYHTKGKDMSLDEVKRIIEKNNKRFVCFTGGEPLLYKKEIIEIIKELRTVSSTKFTIETNGDYLEKKDLRYFNYLAVSPKEVETAKRVYNFLRPNKMDIKVVTDLERVGVDMLKYATMLMPLTTGDKEKDLKIKRKVWEYCIKNNINYSPRIQVEIWGMRRGK